MKFFNINWIIVVDPFFVAGHNTMWKPLSILSLKLFTSKETPYNVSRLQLVRNSISLFLNHCRDFEAFWNGLLSTSQWFQMKAENQNLPQMTRIWLENWHLQSRINLWCKHKLTNVVLSLCWQMSKLSVWHFLSAYFGQYLPLQPSIEKWRKQSCTFNNVGDLLKLYCHVFSNLLWYHLAIQIFNERYAAILKNMNVFGITVGLEA